MSSGIEFFVHGDAGRLVLLPETEAPVEAFGTAVDELLAAALTGGAHPCDVAFGRDVVAVLAAAARALETGCREQVGGDTRNDHIRQIRHKLAEFPADQRGQAHLPPG